LLVLGSSLLLPSTASCSSLCSKSHSNQREAAMTSLNPAASGLVSARLFLRRPLSEEDRGAVLCSPRCLRFARAHPPAAIVLGAAAPRLAAPEATDEPLVLLVIDLSLSALSTVASFQGS
jgi:hypothetical protein